MATKEDKKDLVSIRLHGVPGLRDDQVMDLEVEMSHDDHRSLRDGSMPYYVLNDVQYVLKATDTSEGKVVLVFVRAGH